MDILKKPMPSGVWLFAGERALSGGALLFAAFGGLRMVQEEVPRGGTAALALLGLLLVLTAAGLTKRKMWGWLLAVIETVVMVVAGVVGVTYAALSFPAALGRGWLAGFIAVVLVSFVAMIALLAFLIQARAFFKDRDHDWRVGKWNQGLVISVIVLLAVRIIAAGVVAVNLDSLRSAGGGGMSELEHAVAYCGTLDADKQRNSCFTQIAVAAFDAGEKLPVDFCSRVSVEAPQLKFLCIAYARQIESCTAFPVVRERILCRALVSGKVEECATLADEERAVCESTVAGYLETLRQEQK